MKNKSANRWMQIAGITVLLLATAVGWSGTRGETGLGEEILYAPDFTLNSLDGEEVTLSKLRGQVVLVNFWATWCAPCRYEIPDLSRIYDKYKSQGLIVLGVSVDEIESKHLVKFSKNYKMTYPVLHGTPSELNRLTQLYGGIYSIPTTFIIGRDGVISTIFVGARREKAFLEAIEPLL